MESRRHRDTEGRMKGRRDRWTQGRKDARSQGLKDGGTGDGREAGMQGRRDKKRVTEMD